jgi:hypothetical protein
MTRDGLRRAALWTLICFVLFILLTVALLAGDCRPGDGACLATKEQHRQVIVVGLPIIWLTGLVFSWLRSRKA